MNDRPTASTITDAQLDALHERLARVENLRDKWLAFPADDMHYAAGLMLSVYLDGTAYGSSEPRPASVASSSAPSVPCPACARADQAGLAPGEQHPTCASVEAEAIRQLDADPHGLKAGMIVQSYREYGQEKWVFRCWGTDTCPGLVSLDHFSEQAAERARDRHLAEEHTD